MAESALLNEIVAGENTTLRLGQYIRATFSLDSPDFSAGNLVLQGEITEICTDYAMLHNGLIIALDTERIFIEVFPNVRAFSRKA